MENASSQRKSHDQQASMVTGNYWIGKLCCWSHKLDFLKPTCAIYFTRCLGVYEGRRFCYKHGENSSDYLQPQQEIVRESSAKIFWEVFEFRSKPPRWHLNIRLTFDRQTRDWLPSFNGVGRRWELIWVSETFKQEHRSLEYGCFAVRDVGYPIHRNPSSQDEKRGGQPFNLEKPSQSTNDHHVFSPSPLYSPVFGEPLSLRSCLSSCNFSGTRGGTWQCGLETNIWGIKAGHKLKLWGNFPRGCEPKPVIIYPNSKLVIVRILNTSWTVGRNWMRETLRIWGIASTVLYAQGVWRRIRDIFDVGSLLRTSES